MGSFSLLHWVIVFLLIAILVGIVALLGRFAKWRPGRMALMGGAFGAITQIARFILSNSTVTSTDVLIAELFQTLGAALAWALLLAIIGWIRMAVVWATRRRHPSN